MFDWLNYLGPIFFVVIAVTVVISLVQKAKAKIKENPSIFEPIKTKYRVDMARRKAMPVNYLPIFILIAVAVFQFYRATTNIEAHDQVQYTYFGILFFICTLTLIPEAVNDKKMGKLGAIFITVIFSALIIGLYLLNPLTEIFYIVIFAYLNVIYHLVFANQKEIEKNTTSGGCMLLLFILVVIITIVLAINSSTFQNFADEYNMYYFFNGLYFLAMAWINYNTQKHV